VCVKNAANRKTCVIKILPISLKENYFVMLFFSSKKVDIWVRVRGEISGHMIALFHFPTERAQCTVGTVLGLLHAAGSGGGVVVNYLIIMCKVDINTYKIIFLH
jgi:hypothetical protein